MEQVNVAYGYCPECLHPMYIVEGDITSYSFHDDECTRRQYPLPCKDLDEVNSIAELLYIFLRPNLN